MGPCRKRSRHLPESSLREQADQLEGHGDTIAALNPVVPLPCQGVLEQIGLASKQVRKKAHVVGVIGHDQESRAVAKA